MWAAPHAEGATWVSFCTWVPEGGLGVVRDLKERRENSSAGLQRRRGAPPEELPGRPPELELRWEKLLSFRSLAVTSQSSVRNHINWGESRPQQSCCLRRACWEHQLWVTSTGDANSRVIAAWKVSQCQRPWRLLGVRRRREKRWNRYRLCASTETGLPLNAVAPKQSTLAPPGTFENLWRLLLLVCGRRRGGSGQTSTVPGTEPPIKAYPIQNVNSVSGAKPRVTTISRNENRGNVFKKFYFCAIEFLNTNMCRYTHVSNTMQGWILGKNPGWKI